MALNASGIRDTSRVLDISPPTVIKILREKGKDLDSVNYKALSSIENTDDIEVVIRQCDEAEMDEMWSYVGDKSNQHWLWHAIDLIQGRFLRMFLGAEKTRFLFSCRNC